MATDQTNNGGLTFLAGSDLSASKFCAVNLNSSGRLALPSAGGRIVGVLYSEPEAAGEAATVMPPGRKVKAKAGGSFDAGADLKVDASGRFVTASAADVGAGQRAAIAVDASTGAGQIVQVYLCEIGGVAASGIETLSAPGTVTAETSLTLLAIDGTDPHTLEDGLYDGQIKEIIAISAANSPSSVVTGSYLEGTTARTTATFNAAADYLRLAWDATEEAWRVLIATSVTMG